MRILMKIVRGALRPSTLSESCHCGLCGGRFRPNTRLDFFCYDCKKGAGILVLDSFAIA